MHPAVERYVRTLVSPAKRIEQLEAEVARLAAALAVAHAALEET